MPSGLIQLVRYGNQDIFFTGNPQITYFKSVYRRYTNFAMELVRQNFQDTDNSLLISEVRKVRTKIERYGDLIHDMYFVFTLPEIKSTEERRFRWIKNIGTNLINHANFMISGQTIDKHYGEWFNIWNELTLPSDKEETYNRMIGNIPELYCPENAPGNNGIYPSSDIDNDFMPSIQQYQIYVPLIFWFNRNPGLAFPLIALQYNFVEIEFELKSLKQLYTIIETDPTRDEYGYRVKPNSFISGHGIENFVSNGTIVSVDQNNNRVLQKFDIDPFLLINYIYLDEDERRRFAFNQHEYLIEKTRQSTFLGLEGSHSLELDLHHMVKELIWVTKRNDADDRNDWNNYTNWLDEKIPPYSTAYYNEYGATQEMTLASFPYYKSSDILTESVLYLDGFERFREQTAQYFNMVQPFKHHNKCPKRGIHVYSFAIDAGKFPQPTGAINMGHYNKIQLKVVTQSVYTNENYKFDVNVYSLEYNILRIVGGMGGLSWS